MLLWPLASSPAVALVLIAAGGFVYGPGLVATFSVRQEEAPAELQSQVFMTGAGLKTASFAIGSALSGALVVELGAAETLVLAAVLHLLAGARRRRSPRAQVGRAPARTRPGPAAAPTRATGRGARARRPCTTPLAIPTVRTPIALPHAMSCGVSPITNVRSRSGGSPIVASRHVERAARDRVAVVHVHAEGAVLEVAVEAVVRELGRGAGLRVARQEQRVHAGPARAGRRGSPARRRARGPGARAAASGSCASYARRKAPTVSGLSSTPCRSISIRAICESVRPGGLQLAVVGLGAEHLAGGVLEREDPGPRGREQRQVDVPEEDVGFVSLMRARALRATRRRGGARAAPRRSCRRPARGRRRAASPAGPSARDGGEDGVALAALEVVVVDRAAAARRRSTSVSHAPSTSRSHGSATTPNSAPSAASRSAASHACDSITGPGRDEEARRRPRARRGRGRARAPSPAPARTAAPTGPRRAGCRRARSPRAPPSAPRRAPRRSVAGSISATPGSEPISAMSRTDWCECPGPPGTSPTSEPT